MGFKVGDVVRRKAEYIGGGYTWPLGTESVTVVSECDNVIAFDEAGQLWDSQCFELVQTCSVECRILTENLRTALHLALSRLNEQDRGATGLAKGFEEVLAAMNRGERIVVRDE